MINRYDWRQSDVIEREVIERGCAIMTGVESKKDFLDACSQYGDIIHHRDSEDSGITRVQSRREVSSEAGFTGFSTHELSLHTDRSNLNEPPNLLALCCAKESAVGGETRCVDGRKLFKELEHNHPDVLEWAEGSHQVIFSDSRNMYTGPIFRYQGEGRTSIQFRCDGNGYYRKGDIPLLDKFLSVAESIEITFKLSQGEAIIINNLWWMHGRKSFSGEREMWRLHMAGKANFGKGFVTNLS